jgi:hydrogenase/urease accessory protein HupE
MRLSLECLPRRERLPKRLRDHLHRWQILNPQSAIFNFNPSIQNSPQSSILNWILNHQILNGAIALALLAAEAGAHPLAPSLLELRELGEGRVEVTWTLPRLRPPGPGPLPVLPASCGALGEPEAGGDALRVWQRWTADCGASLVGTTVHVDGLEATGGSAVVRAQLADGRTVQGVASARRPGFTIPYRPGRGAVLGAYARLGVEHILSGLDHLLFVVGLLLLTRTMRLLVATVTAFTAGHSVTLTLAALGIIALPSGPIEVAIALSVFALAAELARRPPAPSLLRRFPWTLAMLFGLLHGLGFAAGLREAGLPSGEIPVALAAFNAGIEAGQLLFVLAVVGLRAAVAPLLSAPPVWLERVPVYAMGSLAAFWSFERLAALLR